MNPKKYNHLALVQVGGPACSEGVAGELLGGEAGFPKLPPEPALDSRPSQAIGGSFIILLGAAIKYRMKETRP